MNREKLIAVMLELLQHTLDDHATPGHRVRAAAELPLVGDDSLLSSMALVSFIADLENALARKFGVEIILVNEKALSRKNSPFLTPDTLADYILEVTFSDVARQPEGVPAIPAALVTADPADSVHTM